MTYVIAGLGNPGNEYAESRHNAGRTAVEAFRKVSKFPEWSADKRTKSLVSKGERAVLVLPDNFMNNSGPAVAGFVKNAKQAERLIVAHDDIDLPLGTVRIVFDRGAGGHKGVESVIRRVKTTRFIRVRIGIAPVTHSGKVKKPADTTDFVIKRFTPKERETMKKVYKKTAQILADIVSDGYAPAMNRWN